MTEKKENRVKHFVEDHWVEISIVAGIAVVGLGYLGIRYLPRINQAQVKTAIKASIPKVVPVVKELPHKNLWENLSGEALTPTGLGNEVLTTAQKINKRLIDCGLQERAPCGEYMLTVLGEKFGKRTWKVTKAGHSFSNIEWDKRVLELIFSAEELDNVRELKGKIAEIMAA